MKTVRLHDLTFSLSIEQQEIEKEIKRIASEVEDDYRGKCPIFISVLNGAFRFTGTFMDNYTEACEVHFIRIKSYEGTVSTGAIKEILGLDCDISNRDIILLEDIVDTGRTISALHAFLEAKNPKSIRIASLFFKPDIYRKSIPIDYIGKSIPNDFIVGYGLDYDQLGRNLNDIYLKN